MTCWRCPLRCVPNTGDTLLILRRDQGFCETADPQEGCPHNTRPCTWTTPSTRPHLRMCTQPPLPPQLPPQLILGGHPHAWWSTGGIQEATVLPGKGGLRKAPTAAGRSCSVCPWPQGPWPLDGKGGGHFLQQKMKAISTSSNMKMAITPQTKSQRAACAAPVPRVCKAGALEGRGC